MSWNNNDGPWGPSGGKSGGNPWTRKPPGNGGGDGGPQPPDLDKFFREIGEALQRLNQKFGGPPQAFMLALAILIALWIVDGFYQVGTDQVGVVMRFGAFDRMDGAGLRYHLPYPIEDVLVRNVTGQNAIQVGVPTTGRMGESIRAGSEESMMLTQDQNIINVEFNVQWRISDIQKFLFEIRDPEQTIKMAAESTMREVIGENKLQFELTDGRGQIADDARNRLQKLMDTYNAGVIIAQINLQTVSVPDEVKAAFQDVVNAHSDQERFQNEAETVANNVIPAAKGDAAQIVQQAKAYRDQQIDLAQGEAARFKSVLAAYDQSRDVTSKRLYLETMESVLGKANKIILDKSATGTVPYLPLPDLMHAPKTPEGGK